MFDLINGLPVHTLVVHAVVVLLPLGALGAIALAVRPRWRHTYGPLVLAALALATVLLPVATSSGEALEERVGSPGEHAELGDSLIWFTIPVLLLVAAMVWFDRRPDKRPSLNVLRGVGVVAVIAALAMTVQVVRVGDSGARAAWSSRVGSSSASTGDGDGD
ncbi:DUF2231 domain-containing protein [Nocardioides mesophilus]|uniref:DUF2231 domain-containing protein n=1 Tax=Nocardioides mesophilus TaxID=433659 RepID=A0A7G9REU7_9ACTN|nr:DUF2231 domain-containing protein [Nocardioides mesophilus]QNN54122.1 hypothetical protein H9L09_07045 [Nocardioides mesophilus]